MTETYTNETGQWGYTITGALWCTTCSGHLMITCDHSSGLVNEYGGCFDCDDEGARNCPTCER